MAMNYEFNYAEIELDTGLCVGVISTSRAISNPALIPIPVYDEEYAFKYYLNGAWYEDAEGAIPWQSSLL